MIERLLMIQFARIARTVALLAVALLCSGCSSRKAEASLTPTEAGVRMWFGGLSEDQMDYAFSRIGEGRSEWLRLVPRLSARVDADPAEELRDHLGLALPKNAPGVLAAIDPKNGPVTGVDSVCSMPFGNNLPNPLPDDFAARSIAAVMAVREPKLQTLRNRCLAVLRRGECLVCGAVR